jgi:hypothetical protein
MLTRQSTAVDAMLAFAEHFSQDVASSSSSGAKVP